MACHQDLLMHPGSAQLKSQNASLILHVPVFSSCLKLILNFFFWIGISASSVMGFLFVCLFFWKINHSLNISLSLPLIFFFHFSQLSTFPSGSCTFLLFICSGCKSLREQTHVDTLRQTDTHTQKSKILTILADTKHRSTLIDTSLLFCVSSADIRLYLVLNEARISVGFGLFSFQG